MIIYQVVRLLNKYIFVSRRTFELVADSHTHAECRKQRAVHPLREREREIVPFSDIIKMFAICWQNSNDSHCKSIAMCHIENQLTIKARHKI